MTTATEIRFSFSDLSEDAKEKARNWFREDYPGSGFDWWDSVYDSFVLACEILGVDIDYNVKPIGLKEYAIYFNLGYSQSDYAAFDASYRYKKGSAKAIRKEFPEFTELHRIADALTQIQRKYFYKLTARVKTSNRGNLVVDVEHYEDQYRDIGDAESKIQDLMRDLADVLYRALRDEYEYLTSNECVDDSIIANDYAFDEDGNVI